VGNGTSSVIQFRNGEYSSMGREMKKKKKEKREIGGNEGEEKRGRRGKKRTEKLAGPRRIQTKTNAGQNGSRKAKPKTPAFLGKKNGIEKKEQKEKQEEKGKRKKKEKESRTKTFFRELERKLGQKKGCPHSSQVEQGTRDLLAHRLLTKGT